MFKYILLSSLLISSVLVAETKVLSFAGSTRQDSYNKKLAKEAADMAEKMGAKVTYIDLKDYPLPFYDGDLEKSEGLPENAKKLRQLMIDSDKIIIASPSYNGSFTAVLKNTIDWASRSEDGSASRDAFKGKKFLIIATSPSPQGGVKGLHHLRDVITNIGGEVMEVEFGVPNASKSFDSQGKLIDPKLRETLQSNVQRLIN